MSLAKSITDEELVLGMKKQDIKIQKVFYLRYGPVLQGVCFRYLKPRENAEEVFHDVVLKVYDKIGKYSGKGSLIAWCKRLAVNTCLDYLRKHKNHIRINYLEEQDVEVEDKKEDLEMLDNAKLSQLVEYISELPEQQQVVLNLFVMDGFSHREISTRLAVSEGASRSLLQRAKSSLKNRLGIERTVLKRNENNK